MGKVPAPRRGKLKNQILVSAILALLVAQGMMFLLVYSLGVNGAAQAQADLTKFWIQKSEDITTGFAFTLERSGALGNLTLAQAEVDGFVATHPDVQLLKLYTADAASPTGYVTSVASNTSVVGDPADAGDIAAITTNQSTYNIGPSEGGAGRAIEVIAPVHDATGRAVASVSLAWSLDTLDQSVGGLQRTFITGLVGSALVLLGLSVLVFLLVFNEVAQRITNPLVSLRKAAEAVSLGNFEAPIDTDRRDEIGDLAESFERMRASLKLARRLSEPVEPRGR